MGASVNLAGWSELVACPTIRAIGFSPCLSIADSLASTKAEAPSEIELELAAVTVPSDLNAGLRVGIFSMFALPGCSSSETVYSPFRVLTVTVTVSSSSAPDHDDS